jgi:hypothetical protein
MKRKIIFALLALLCCTLFACAPEDQTSKVVTREEYDSAFTQDSLENVTIRMTGPYYSRDKVQSYFYNDGSSFAQMNYRDGKQYYGCYYGVLDSKEFCYLYQKNGTDENEHWYRYNYASEFRDNGVQFVGNYKRDFDELRFDASTGTYRYDIIDKDMSGQYIYHFKHKKLVKFEIKADAYNYHYVWDFYDYGNTQINVKTKDDENKTKLIETYEETYPRGGKAIILAYYGEYQSGAIVAMMTGEDVNYPAVVWTEKVAGYDFNYGDGNRIAVLHEGQFCSLEMAYNDYGILKKSDIADIYMQRKGLILDINAQNITVSAKYESDSNWESDVDYPVIQKLDTLQDFTQYCEQKGIRSISYDEQFFENKYLLAVAQETTNSAMAYVVQSVKLLSNGTYLVYLYNDPYLSGAGSAVMGRRHIFIELDKTVVITQQTQVEIITLN